MMRQSSNGRQPGGGASPLRRSEHVQTQRQSFGGHPVVIGDKPSEFGGDARSSRQMNGVQRPQRGTSDLHRCREDGLDRQQAQAGQQAGHEGWGAASKAARRTRNFDAGERTAGSIWPASKFATQSACLGLYGDQLDQRRRIEVDQSGTTRCHVGARKLAEGRAPAPAPRWPVPPARGRSGRRAADRLALRSR